MKEKMKKVKCDSCGKNLTVNRVSTIGLVLEAKICENYEDAGEDYGYKSARNSLGAYKPNKQYNVCWECWLKSMNVKP